MADVHNFISTALQEGHPIEDIVGFLGSSDNPEEKAWAQRWQATAAQPAYEAGATQETTAQQPNTTMLEDFSNLSTPAKVATGAGVLAGSALLGAGAYAGKKAIDVAADVRREKALSQIEPSAAVKVQQGDLALRQAQFEASRQATTAGEVPLSPVEQIKLEREKLKLEADRQKLAREAELHTQKITQMARQQELNEAKAQAAAAKQAAASTQKTTASGAVNPEDRQMLQSSEKAKMDKAITTEQNIVAKKAVGIQPPATAVQLTPSAEVVAEPVTPVAKSAPAGTVPVESAPVVAAVPPKKAPKATLPMPEGWGKGMSWLVNQHGVEGAQDYINRFNKGAPFASYDEMMKSYQENTMRPKYSDIPKDIRKSRGIAPPTQAGIAAMGAAVAPRTSLGSQQDLTQGGGAVLHLLNPLKF